MGFFTFNTIKMHNPVTITADITGAVVGMNSNNPEYGYIRVEQNAARISTRGWLTLNNRSALLKGTIEDLRAANFREGDVLPGKIVVKESLTAFNMEDPDRDLKRAGESGVVCTLDDQPIYRQTIYTTDTSEEDELIQHNNGDTIREQIALQKAQGILGSTRLRKGDLP